MNEELRQKVGLELKVPECAWFKIAREQALHESERGEDPTGVDFYREAGCYNCDGFSTDCSRYLTDETRK